MKIRAAHPHQTGAKVNVTPLIDVVMVLIVFYLIVGNLARERLAPVDLPATGVGTAEDAAPTLIITVAREGEGARVVVDGAPVAAGALEGLLRARVPDPGTAIVQLRADRSLAYEDVRPVLDACRRVGLTSVRLVAERGGGS
ncbi:MAG: biopolymer transporter ExbD [Planctomycetota bacterium]|nr:biopolymer transporter ExbD [Planctomycetota bacterium]